MSRERLEQHRRAWRDKPSLARIYAVWFEALLGWLPRHGTVVEVGAGAGFLAAYAHRHRPELDWIALDVIEAPWQDVVADAQRLPVRELAIDALVGLDLVHHLSHPTDFFAEAARVLVPGGRLAVIEPWLTPFSYPIYRFLHHEDCRLKLDPENPFATSRDETKPAFLGDSAVFWQLVRKTPAATWKALGFAPPAVRILNGFAYILSGGFKKISFLPERLAPVFIRLDELARPASAVLGMRAFATWERLGPD